MRPILFHLGSFSVSSFGLMMVLGFLSAGLLMRKDFVRKGVSSDLAWSIVLWGALGGIVGSRLLEAVHDWDALVADPVGALTGLQGMVWYGGLLGGFLATLWPIHRSGIGWASAADSAAPALAIGQAFGRLGCHLAGDADWGVPTTLPWGVAYTDGVSPWPHAEGVVVHPAPIYEALTLLAICAVLWRLRTRVDRPGNLFALYLLLAGSTRFLIEFIRTSEPVLLGLTEAQWVAVVLVAGALLWIGSGSGSKSVAGTP